MKHITSLFVSVGLLMIPGMVGAQSPTNSTTADASEKTQPCFQCKGNGQSKCVVPSCKNGQANCPAPCLKPDDGTWVRMTVAGHPPTDLWKQFPKRGGGSTGWNQKHAGEVVQMQNGEPVNIGPCKVCGGTTKVKCGACKGTGQVICPICDGKKVVPQSWSAFDNPKMKNRPSRFTLKDGRVLVGRKMSVLGSSVTIKTEKESLRVEAGDIVSEEKPTTQKTK